MAKPVLLIAHTFPPQSGPGVFRSYYFARHLVEMGYKPYVLTISNQDIEENQYKTDPALEAALPPEVEVIRIATGEPRGFIKFFQRLRIFRLFWFLAYPLFWESSARWPYRALKPALEAIKKHNIPLIYTSSGPFSAILLGARIKRRANVKWVIDIRDPFTDGYMWQWPSKLHWFFSRFMEKRLYPKADKVIVNTPEVRALYLKRKLVSPENLTVITNGF